MERPKTSDSGKKPTPASLRPMKMTEGRKAAAKRARTARSATS